MIWIVVFSVFVALAIVLLRRGKPPETNTGEALPFRAFYYGERTEKAFLVEIEPEAGFKNNDYEVPEHWIPFSIFDEANIKERLDEADEQCDGLLELEIHLPRWLAEKEGLTKSWSKREKRGDETPLTVEVFFVARSESGKAVFVTTCEPSLCKDGDDEISVYETRSLTLGKEPGAVACWLPLREVVGLPDSLKAGDFFSISLPVWLADQKGLSRK